MRQYVSGQESTEKTPFKMIDLVKERKELIKKHLAGASGRKIVYAYTQLVDKFIKEQGEGLIPPTAVDEVAIIAIGGYGRKEMSFYSDADLLILHVENPSAILKDAIVHFVQSLWDSKLKLDHSFRTIEECLQIAKKDFFAFMAMLTPRFLGGNRALFEQLIQTLNKYLIIPHRREILKNIWERREKRHQHYNRHTYFLEPHIKEGRGGLRDIHTLRWGAIVAFGHEELPVHSFKEKKSLEIALDFLWRVRNHLHYLSKRENDELSFVYQEEIAHFLGFKDSPGIKAVENFMRAFFTHTFKVEYITRLFFNYILEEQKSSSSFYPRKELAPGIDLYDNQIRVNNKEVFLKQPALLIKVYTWAASLGANLSFTTQCLVCEAVEELKKHLSENIEVRDAFLEFLNIPRNLLSFFEDMTYQGLLCAIIPQWHNILHLPQHNVYHIYTVDFHAFHTVEEIKRLRRGEYRDKYPIFTKVAQTCDDWDTLLLAALFHDFGKAIGRPHAETGANETEKILKRWRLPQGMCEDIIWLIRHHLLLSHIAQRRDLEEERVVIDTAQIVGNISRLKMLYVLTFADAKATGPRAFTDWKMALITELFLKLERVLEKGEFSRADIWVKLQAIKKDISLRLHQQYTQKEIKHFFEVLPPRYLLSTPLEDILFHLRLIHQLNGKPAALHWAEASQPQYYKVTIATRDAPGLFAKMAGVLSLNGFNIVNAQAYTWKNKIALDIFWVNTKTEIQRMPQKWKKVEQHLCRALKGAIDLEMLLEAKYYTSDLFRKKGLPKVETEIKLDNETSDFYTIVEVYTADRPALLFKLAQCLFKLELNIHIAKISTRLDQVVDVFYIEEKAGGKVRSPGRLSLIKYSLEKALKVQT